MKKPSTQIAEIITNAMTDGQGNTVLSAEESQHIIDLCKMTDRRDQQIRRAYRAKHPAQKATKRRKVAR